MRYSYKITKTPDVPTDRASMNGGWRFVLRAKMIASRDACPVYAWRRKSLDDPWKLWKTFHPVCKGEE